MLSAQKFPPKKFNKCKQFGICFVSSIFLVRIWRQQWNSSRISEIPKVGLILIHLKRLSKFSSLLGRWDFQQRDEMFADKNASLISFKEIAKKFPMRKRWEKHPYLFIRWPQNHNQNMYLGNKREEYHISLNNVPPPLE